MNLSQIELTDRIEKLTGEMVEDWQFRENANSFSRSQNGERVLNYEP